MMDKYETVAAATGIERVEVLHGHVSQETAYLQEDYPYGRTLRCQRRVWIEKAVKGSHAGEFRFVTQTSNPKRDDDWNNKPHASTYYRWAVMYRKPELGDDYISWSALGFWGPTAAADVRIKVSGIFDGLDEAERKLYDLLVRLSHKGASNSWASWETEVIPALAAHHAEHGTFTNPADTMALGTYLAEHDHQAACAAVLLRELDTD